MAASSRPIQPQPIPRENILKIAPWGHNCAAACMADFIAEMFLNDKMHPVCVTNLCAMLSKYYNVAMTKEDLRTLLGEEYISPYQWQFILGLPFRQVCQRAGLVEESGAMSNEAFGHLADYLGFNVAFYTQQPAGILPSIIPSIEKGEALPRLDVFYKAPEATVPGVPSVGHYDRISLNASFVAKHNAWEGVEGRYVDGKLVRRLPKDNESAMKAQIQADIGRIQRAREIKPQQAVNAASQGFKGIKANLIGRLERGELKPSGQKVQELYNKTSDAKREEKSIVMYSFNNFGSFNLSGFKAVSQETQKDLDQELAKLLQEEEYQAYRNRR